jgi:uncharacterized protein (DUF924 family)
MHMTAANDVVNYWLDEIGPSHWYSAGDGLDKEIRNRF